MPKILVEGHEFDRALRPDATGQQLGLINDPSAVYLLRSRREGGDMMGIDARSATKLSYRPELDGIRAIAVLSVMLGHSSLIGKGADLLSPGLQVALPSIGAAKFGVDIFFVLSGFLITTLLLLEHARWKQLDFKAFYIRRALRLAPAMFITLLGCSLYLLIKGSPVGAFDWLAILYSALYASNFALIFGGLRLGMLTPTWSLSIEEQFYSVWPLIMSRLLKMPRTTVFKSVLLAIVAVWMLRALLYFAAFRLSSWPLFGSANHLILARADGLLLGAAVAMAIHWKWVPTSPPYVTACKAAAYFCAATLLFLPHGPGVVTDPYGPATFYFYYAYASAATAIVILAVFTAPPTIMLFALRLPPLVWIGRISYGLYIYHLPIFALTPLTFYEGGQALVFAWTLTFGFAALSFFLIEKRFLALRGALGAPRAERLSSAAGALQVSP